MWKCHITLCIMHSQWQMKHKYSWFIKLFIMNGFHKLFGHRGDYTCWITWFDVSFQLIIVDPVVKLTSVHIVWMIECLICLFRLLLQEIPLSEILEVRPARDFSLVPAGTSPHCFEIMTGTMIYFVGEDPNTTPPPSSSESGLPISFTPCSVAPNSGVGREFAKGWETAIRQALMPVIFQDNPPAEGHTPHRKWKVW